MSAARRRRVVAVRLLTSLLATMMVVTGCGLIGANDSSPQASATGSPVTATTSPSPSPTSGPDAFERSGRGSQIRLTLPDSGTVEPYPLVVALHSLYHDGSEPQLGWGLDEFARSSGFAVVYPDGLNLSWNAGTCCGAAAASGVDDVAWLRSLIAHLETRYPIDPRRVSIIGLSNGGMLAYRYACEHGDELAGFAAVAASLQTLSCAPSAPLTTVEIHGSLDGHVPYAGTLWSEPLQTGITPVDVSLAPFRAVDGCPAPTQPGDTSYTGADGRPIGASTNPTAASSGSAGTPTGDGAASAIISAAGPDGQLAGSGTAGSGTAGSGTAAGAAVPSQQATPTTTPVAIRHETLCSTSAHLVQYVLPTLGHGWPALTGPTAFNTAAVLWDLLKDARSATAGPRM
ncbi:PHB depolymerase family esterase [Parafrankia sp. EUN1f]|uniref:alpha/beta hydrolase family esterase n=1 Tax=Parafrankia sp. EUN1f TaxID=102897 RepID=UPI0001C44E8A|nr:PHB depolymerase family esterase [Parafrankia sp. EUN1f]EFC82902.1 Poly(3-hydroxybutyrate) depolymerase-like protein [Parafrankia sp. EUN1f]